MYQGGSMNRRRSQSSQNHTADLYDPFEAQNEPYEQNLGYNASRGGRSYDNYGMTTGSRKRQASLENYGNTKQQRMGMDDLRSTTETEQLLKMLVEQNKLIKKQQEIIESRGGLNMSKDQSEIRGSRGNNSGRDHFSSGSNIWDDTDYGQSDLRSSSFESFQDKSRGQDYLTSNYSDSGSRSFDSSRGNMQRNLGYLYEDTNRSSSAAPYVKSVPISQLKELNKYQKNKKEHQKKSAAQSQAWGQKSPKGQGQKGYLNKDKGYGSFSKSSDLPKKSMLKNRMQRSTTTNNQQDEIWGTGTTNKMYEESEAYYQKTGTASYDYKHGQRESDSFYNTEGSYKVPDQHHFKKQQLKSSTNKSGKNRGSEYFEGNPTYDQDGFLISSNLSSLRMQNEQRNSYDDFEYMSNTMSSRKSLERKDFDSSGRSSQQEYPRSLNQQRKQFFQRDSDTGQSYDSFGQSQYSGHQNIDNFERDSSLSYPEEYQNNQYGSERQGQSMMYRSGQSRGFQKEDTNLNYQNISQQSDVFSSDTVYGNLPPRKEMSQSFSNQMQKHQQLPFMNRQKSSLSMDSGLEQGSFQAFGSLMQTSPHLMDRERSRSQMDSFKDSYTDGGQNIFRSRNQRGGFEESYGDGMQKAPNSQMQTSPRFSDPYQSSLSAKSSHQSLTMTGPNRRNKGNQRPTNQRDQRSRLKNQGKNKPSRNSVAMSNSKKPVTVQTFFRNKYNKLRQTASAKNIQSKSNLIRDNKTEPPKAEFLSDLFSSRKSRRQARGNSLNTKNVKVEKTTENHSPRPSTTLSRLTPKTTKLPPNITNVGYFHNRTRGLASALDTSKQVDTLVKDENKGKKDSGEQKVIFVPPKHRAGEKSPLSSLKESKQEIQTEDLTSSVLSRLKPRTTKLPTNVTEVQNFKNRARGLGSALEIFKQVETLTKDEIPVVKTEPSPSKDKGDKSQVTASRSQSQHKITIHVVDNIKKENESAKVQDGSETTNKDKNLQGEGSVTTLIFGNKELIATTGKEDSKGGSEEKMDTSADVSPQKKIHVEVPDKFTYKMKIKLSITPAPASEPVTITMKDKNKTVFVAKGSEADISEPYKDRVIFNGNTTTGDIEFTVNEFGLEDEGVYTASYNGMDFDTPFTKRILYAKDKEDIVMRWTIPPVTDGGSVTVSKQNCLTMFTVTGDVVKATDEYRTRVVYYGDISKGTMLFVLKDCNVGDSGTYVSSYNDVETEGRMLKVHHRVKKREQKKRKETKLGQFKHLICNTAAKETSEKTLMEAANSVGLKLHVQCWCRQISPTEFRHFGVIHITEIKNDTRGRFFFGKDVCLSASSSNTKNEMRTQLFDQAIENLKTNSLDFICALGSKGNKVGEMSTGMWNIDTGGISILHYRTKEELLDAASKANRIEAQRILMSISDHKKYTNKMFIEAVILMYDKNLIQLVDVVRGVREREKHRNAQGHNINFQKILRDNDYISNEKDLAKIGKKSSLTDENLDRFVLFEGSDVKRRMVDAFQWILRSAESCGMLVHWHFRPVYGENTDLLPRFFKKCSIWIQGNLVGESCSYGEKYALRHAAVDAMAYIYENLPVIQKVNKGLPEQYCITYKKAQAKAKLLMEVGNLDEEAAMIKACEDYILQYKDDPTPESLEFCKGFPESIYETIKETSLANNMKVDTTQTDNRTVLSVSKTMDLYKLLGTLLENDGKSGRFRLMKQPECVVIAKEMKRIAENLLFFEENLVNEVDLTDEEAEILKRASEQKEEKNGASEAKKGRFSELVKKQEERQESSKGSGSSGGRGRGKGRGSGLGGRGRGVGRGSGRGVGRGSGRGFSRANFRGGRRR